jgi:hypothetical protein
MSKWHVAVSACALAAAVLVAPAAEAKRYKGDMSDRSMTSAGTSRSCLTSAARALLNRIEDRFGSVQIVSTCRPGAKIAGSGRPSRHASGNAIDFNAPRGKKGAIVKWLAANHHSGGTMTYSGMDHIHVDIGYHFVSLNH